MSFAMITLVQFASDYRGAKLGQQQIYAGAANEDGQGVFIGIPTAAAIGRIDERTARRLRQELVTEGWLIASGPKTGGGLPGKINVGRPRMYSINPAWIEAAERARARTDRKIKVYPMPPSEWKRRGALDTAEGGIGCVGANSTPYEEVLKATKTANIAVIESRIDRDDENNELAQRYFELTKAIGGKREKPDLDVWATTIRRMRQRDELSIETIFEVLTWCLIDKFWFAKVLTPEKLRKHWGTISTQRAGPLQETAAVLKDDRCERVLPDTRQRCGNRPADNNVNKMMICDDCRIELIGN